MKSWPDQIKRYRRMNGMTQAVLAEVLGVEQATVSRWERGTHLPDLRVQRRLRDLLCKPANLSDQSMLYRVLNAISAVKVSDRDARNYAASSAAGRLHGLNQKALASCYYRPFFTDVLENHWSMAIENGFFAGELAGIRLYTSWRPAGGDDLRFCMTLWSPVLMSDGEVLLMSEFADVSEAQFMTIDPPDRFKITAMDELLI